MTGDAGKIAPLSIELVWHSHPAEPRVASVKLATAPVFFSDIGFSQ